MVYHLGACSAGGHAEDMRAAVIHSCGSPASIQVMEREIPKPTADEVMVAVDYAAVNHVDTFVRSGRWATPLSFPFTVGRDAVGKVTAVGPAVDRVHVGQRVWCNSLGYDGRDGATADFVMVSQRRAYQVPPGIRSHEMAALAHPATTAYLALFQHAQLKVHERVLVIGAAGNVGGATVVLARAAGASVVAVAHPRDHDYVRRLGADIVLGHRDRQALVTGNRDDVDVVIDTSGSNDLSLFVDVLRRHGRIVLIAGMSAEPVLPVGAVYLKNLTISGFAISHATIEELENAARHVNWAIGVLGLRPRRVKLFDLSDVGKAHDLLERGDVRGKPVIEIGGREAVPPL